MRAAKNAIGSDQGANGMTWRTRQCCDFDFSFVEDICLGGKLERPQIKLHRRQMRRRLKIILIESFEESRVRHFRMTNFTCEHEMCVNQNSSVFFFQFFSCLRRRRHSSFRCRQFPVVRISSSTFPSTMPKQKKRLQRKSQRRHRRRRSSKWFIETCRRLTERIDDNANDMRMEITEELCVWWTLRNGFSFMRSNCAACSRTTWCRLARIHFHWDFCFGA